MANRTYCGAGGLARRGKKKYAGIYTVPQKKYAFLDYIESSGTQYIDTAFYAGDGTKIVVDCDITYGSDWCMILGSYDSNAFFSWWAKGNQLYAYYASENLTMMAPSGRTVLTADKNIWSANLVSQTFNANAFTAKSTVYLFSVHAGGNYANTSMKLYSCQIYDNGTMKRDYVPAKRMSDGAVGLYDKVEEKFYANAGTGAFAAGAETGEYLYDSPRAADLARIVARAYVGVGGVARRFWGRGEITYRGRAADISQPRGAMASASTERFALFGGGTSNGTSGLKNTVDAYDAAFTRLLPAGLGLARSRLRGASVGQYALFGGGENESATSYANMDAYDGDLTRTAVTALSFAATWPTAESVGGHAIYLGGYYGTNYPTTANAYDTSLTRTTIASASTGHVWLAAARSKSYALFAGGGNGYNSLTNVVDAYDASLTRTTAQVMSVSGRDSGTSGSTGSMALFGGGYVTTSGTRTNTVDAYDDSLTRTIAPVLRSAVAYNVGGRLGDSAVFFSGNNGSEWTTAADAYDDSLTRTAAPALAEAKERLFAASVGHGATAPLLLYHGGYSRVDIYAIA